ncbi:hypothetical protein LXA43DRAFT_431128 [Ganoderma leucocontextum]|nr:hypothetical protein LXA43DRAFT_431128 [Ganoderma leucocontextum]
MPSVHTAFPCHISLLEPEDLSRWCDRGDEPSRVASIEVSGTPFHTLLASDSKLPSALEVCGEALSAPPTDCRSLLAFSELNLGTPHASNGALHGGGPHPVAQSVVQLLPSALGTDSGDAFREKVVASRPERLTVHLSCTEWCAFTDSLPVLSTSLNLCRQLRQLFVTLYPDLKSSSDMNRLLEHHPIPFNTLDEYLHMTVVTPLICSPTPSKLESVHIDAFVKAKRLNIYSWSRH